MNFESILSEVGDFGSYQKRLISCFMVPTTLISSLYVMNVIFMVATPDHWCRVPQLLTHRNNLSIRQIKLLSIPVTLSDDDNLKEKSDGREEFSKCRMYDLDYEAIALNLTFHGGDALIQAPPLGTPVVRCMFGWSYDTSLYQATAVTQWDLVCDDNQLPSLVLTLANVGSVVGTLLFGYTADKYGRRVAFFSNVVLAAVSGTISVLAPNFAVFAVMRMLTGATLPTNFQLPYIITVEQVGANARSWLVCLSWVLWTLGSCLLPLVGYLTGNWVHFGLVTTLPLFTLLLYWKYLPASPRYLMARQRYEEANRSIERIAKANATTVPPNLHQQLTKIGKDIEAEENEQSKFFILDLWRYPQLRKKLIIVTLNWCAIAVSYFGLMINISNLSGNDYLNYFLLSVIELPSFFVACYVMERWGRRWANTSFVSIAGLSCLVPVFTPSGISSMAVVSSLVGKFGSAAAFMVIYQQAAELFPTPVRSLGMSFGSTLSSFIIIFMPYVIYLGTYNQGLPFMILGSFCLVAAVVSPLVPETLHEKLPQTIDESEKFCVRKFCLRRKQHDCDEKVGQVSPNTA